jgi:hypothetical protein
MLSKIMIPVAAFAVTTSAASAFTSNLWQNLDIDLNDEQIEALEEVASFRQGEQMKIREVLGDAGLDPNAMREVRNALHQHRSEQQAAVREAIENEDYEAYRETAADGPHADLIDSKADFEKLVEAHALRATGNHAAADEIMEDLGFERPEGYGRGMGPGKGRGAGGMREGSNCGGAHNGAGDGQRGQNRNP